MTSSGLTIPSQLPTSRHPPLLLSHLKEPEPQPLNRPFWLKPSINPSVPLSHPRSLSGLQPLLISSIQPSSSVCPPPGSLPFLHKCMPRIPSLPSKHSTPPHFHRRGRISTAERWGMWVCWASPSLCEERGPPCSRGIWTSWPSMATPPPCFSFTRLLCRLGRRTVTERVQTASGSSAHCQEGHTE